jgi:anthranilate phosphoribosyltransferase
VHGSDGMDEFTIAGASQVWEIRGDEVKDYLVDPEELGIPRAPASELAGGGAGENARIVRSILEGEDQGPRLQVSLLNAAAVLVAGGRAEDLRDGLGLAGSAVRQGTALEILERMVEFTSAEEECHGA